jgi:serine/threonine protein kinase
MASESGRLPAQIGRYLIRGELGRGMTGVVYDAFDPVLERPIALKVIRTTFAVTLDDQERFERRFLREARLAGRLSDPGIVTVHEAGRDEATGLLYLAMERLEGQTLATLLSNGNRTPWQETVRIVARAAEALDHAHKQGIIHRDVKPANIMVLPSGDVKLMDFGLAIGELGPDRTATGQGIGTPAYMAPEQVQGHPVDARSDVFSLGTVAYALLTGERPFGANRVGETLQRVVRHNPPPPSTLDHDLPPGLDAVIATAMAKAPEERYASARALAQDLEDVLGGRVPQHVTERRSATAASQRLAQAPAQGAEPLDLLVGADRGVAETRVASHARSPGPLRWLPLGMLVAGLLALGSAWLWPSRLSRALGLLPSLGHSTQVPAGRASPPPPRKDSEASAPR